MAASYFQTSTPQTLFLSNHCWGWVGDGICWITVLGALIGGSVGKESANAGDTGVTALIPGSGRFSGNGHGSPLQYSFLGNPMDGGAWWATVHGVTKSRT